MKRFYDPTRPEIKDCTFLRWGNPSKIRDSKKEKRVDRSSVVKRFIKISEQSGKKFLLPLFDPWWDWCVKKISPSRYLRRQYQLGKSNLMQMSIDELFELLRLGIVCKDKDIAISVAKELEKRACSL